MSSIAKINLGSCVVFCCHVSLVFVIWSTPSLISKERGFFCCCCFFKILVFFEYFAGCPSFWVWLINFLMSRLRIYAFDKKITKMMYPQCIISGGIWGQFPFLIILTLIIFSRWCLISYCPSSKGSQDREIPKQGSHGHVCKVFWEQ